jgi:hypothetical protein
MPARFTLDSGKRVVSVTFEGLWSVRDVADYFEDLKRDSEFDSRFFELADLTEVVSSDVDFQAATMLSRIDPFSRSGKRAFAATKAAIYGILRMYQMVRGEEYSMAIFRTLAEAKQWLGIKDL